jgi:hypothetical protein
VVVQSQDGNGNLSKPTPAAFSLTAPPAAGVTFYADPECTGPITLVDLSTPEAAAAFYFKAAQAGPVVLTVSNGILSQSQEETVGGP